MLYRADVLPHLMRAHVCMHAREPRHPSVTSGAAVVWLLPVQELGLVEKGKVLVKGIMAN